jgi:hypothetical protein
MRKIVLKLDNNKQVVAGFDSEIVLLFSKYFTGEGQVNLQSVREFMKAIRSKVSPPNAVDDPTVMLKLFQVYSDLIAKASKKAEKIEVVIDPPIE